MKVPTALQNLDIWYKDCLRCWEQFQLYLTKKHKQSHHDKQRNNERH